MPVKCRVCNHPFSKQLSASTNAFPRQISGPCQAAGPTLPAGRMESGPERKAALESLAALFRDPARFCGSSPALQPLYGFDLRSAEFDQAALKRPRDGAQGHGSGGYGAGGTHGHGGGGRFGTN